MEAARRGEGSGRLASQQELIRRAFIEWRVIVQQGSAWGGRAIKRLRVESGVQCRWRQCIAAAMAKGAAAVLSRSASPGELASERTSTEASQESHPDSGL